MSVTTVTRSSCFLKIQESKMALFLSFPLVATLQMLFCSNKGQTFAKYLRNFTLVPLNKKTPKVRVLLDKKCVIRRSKSGHSCCCIFQNL